jgi:hypothetical protein
MVKDRNALDLEELLEHDLQDAGIRVIMDLVAQHSWWVSTKVYREIQVVYPRTRRKKGITEKRGQIVNGIRFWDNQPASYAFWMALGKDRKNVSNFYVCHIYEESVWDPNHFTNLANLTAFPKCLQSLSEWNPVREVLKYHSFKVFGYEGPKSIEPPCPKYYPLIWRHHGDLSLKEFESVIVRLKEQKARRPQFKSFEEIVEATNYHE